MKRGFLYIYQINNRDHLKDSYHKYRKTAGTPRRELKPRLFIKKLKRPCKPRLHFLQDGKPKKSPPEDFSSGGHHSLDEKRRLPTLPHCIAVPSAQAGLTSLFGMGRGGTPPLSPPDMGDMRLRYRQIS